MRGISTALLAAVLVLGAGGVRASQDAAEKQRAFEEQLRRTQKSINDAAAGPVPEYLKRPVPQAYQAEAEAQAARVREIQRDAIRQSALDSGIAASELQGTALDKNPVNVDAGRIAIFISSSMPRSQIRDILANTARPHVSVMIRGLIPGTKNFLETQKALAEIAKDIQPRPDIVLNPIAFSNHKVNVAPTVIFAGEKQGEEALRVEGNVNLEYLAKRLEDGKGKPVKLGRLGPVFDVVEEDMIVVMKQRYESIDWEKKAREARDRYFTKYQFVELPPARTSSTRTIDPTVVVTEDVRNPRDENQLIARAGERHNPLEKIPLTRRVIVFDARDPKQLQIVRELRKRPVLNKMDVYITTGLSRDEGWKQHSSISNEFASPLYLLNIDLKTMMRLRSVPSVVTAEGKNLVIEEIKVPL